MASEKENGKSPPPARPVNVTLSTLAKANLECTAGPEKGQTLRVAPGTTTVGRDPSCDIILSETAISRQHFRIERRAEQWHLRNLSSNGTLVNKKPADDVLLADGDEIRIGVKTRLRFAVEAVSLSTTGRPQFRRRTGAPEEAGDDAEKAEEQQEEARPSLFQRRRGLFIGLGIYLAAMVVIAGAVTYYRSVGGGKSAGGEIPILGEEDSVRPEPGAKPLRIVREDIQGIWVEDRTGPRLIPAADLEAHKAVRIIGIRKSLDVKYEEVKKARPGYPFTIEEVNPAKGKQCEAKALELYRVRNMAEKPAALFGAVRLFQQALAYNGGRGYFEDSAVNTVYRSALDELTKTVTRLYSNAAGPEEKSDPKRAMETYKRLLTMLPEINNPIYINVSRRMTQLGRTMPEGK